MVVEKCPPALRWWLASPGHQPRHGSLGNFKAETLQFSMDAGRTPQRVGLGHLFDQRSDLCRDPWPTDAFSPRQPSPIETENLTMPGDNSLRFDDNQSLSPHLGSPYRLTTPIQSRRFGLLPGRAGRFLIRRHLSSLSPCRQNAANIDCVDYEEGLYSPPSQTRTVLNQSQVSPTVRRDSHASSANIATRSERRTEV